MTDFTISTPEQRARFVAFLGVTEDRLKFAADQGVDFVPKVIAFMQDLPLDGFEALYDLAVEGNYDRVISHIEFADLHRDDS